MKDETPIRAVIFDYGGVLAEEGFRRGLKHIARENGLDPEAFFALAVEEIFRTGYVTGECGESVWWQALRDRAGIRGADAELRREILERFQLRPDVMALADDLKARGFQLGVLSDQTDWLDELDARDGIFRHFDVVLNSFHEHDSKQNHSFFRLILERMGVEPGQAVFIDDNEGNVQRAREVGLAAIFYTSREAAAQVLGEVLPEPSG